MAELKLFVVGESSGNPDEWRDSGGRVLVIATDPAEALSLIPEGESARLYTPIEVSLVNPALLAIEPIPPSP
jgi:hypothetical protein